jgi:hypothetical protein
MRRILISAFILVGATIPALAQRSLFDQPVGGAAPPIAAPVPAAPAPAPTPAPAAPPPAAAPSAPAEEPAAAPRKRAAPRKPAGPTPARSLAITNGTPQALVGLEVTQEGRSATLKKPVAAGKKARLALPAFKACEVSVTASFEGQAAPEASTVDICKEKSLNFRD